MKETTIGMRIKQARKYLKISARELGEALGMATGWQSIYNWELGRSDVPDKYYLRFLELGINPTWLLTGTGLPYAENSAGLALMQKRGHESIPASIIAGAKLEEVALQSPVDAHKAMANYMEDKASNDEKVFLIEKATIGLAKISDAHEIRLDDHERRIVRLEVNLN